MDGTAGEMVARGSRALRAAGIDPERPIEIADRVFWVGHYLEGDPFQCHAYLIDAGDQSVLIDPGSKLTFAQTLGKIEHILPLRNIRYFVCHHQDPDITGAMPLIDQLVHRPDAAIVTHGRAEVLLRHYGLNMGFLRIEDQDWQLTAGDRRIRFVFTPYLHFPGAFCSYDTATGVLFSSDLFGGFTDGFSLYAEDESYFAAMRPFHEHYMPSREILAHGLSRLDDYDIAMIAPQHGSIIPRPLVRPIIDRLKQLDCGLYLMAERTTDVRHLVRLNEVLRGITETMAVHREFSGIAAALVDLARRMLPVSSLEFYAEAPGDPTKVLYLAQINRFRGSFANVPETLLDVLMVHREEWIRREGKDYREIDDWPIAGPAYEEAGHPALVIPLFAPDRQVATACAILHFHGDDIGRRTDLDLIVRQMSLPLQVALERECLYRAIDLERQVFYEQSIRDPLTGLYTRIYMQDNITRIIDLNNRDKSLLVGLLMLDVDHFKDINDTFGHVAGDAVLRRIGGLLAAVVRSADIPVRLGGEEFGVFCIGQAEGAIRALAERIRTEIEVMEWDDLLDGRVVTVSVGLTLRKPHESLAQVLGRADEALYDAKRSGRNCVVLA